MLVKVELNFKLKNHSYHAQGKPHWKLFRREGLSRIPILIYPVRGDHFFSKELDLLPGYYTLSLGSGSKLYEKNFLINEKGIKWFEGEKRKSA